MVILVCNVMGYLLSSTTSSSAILHEFYTYHKVLCSAATKQVLISIINEMYSPLNELSNGCLGSQYYWILAATGSLEVKREGLFRST